jgi:hypothetical protein
LDASIIARLSTAQIAPIYAVVHCHVFAESIPS